VSKIASRWLVIPGQPLTGHQQSPQVVQSDRAGQTSSCVAGAPLRSPPRLREDATGPQRDGLGHRPDSAGSQKVRSWYVQEETRNYLMH
jgi:hypothetical protein